MVSRRATSKKAPLAFLVGECGCNTGSVTDLSACSLQYSQFFGDQAQRLFYGHVRVTKVEAHVQPYKHVAHPS